MWDKITSEENNIYYQSKIKLGAANIWLTACDNEWHIDIADYQIASGKADNFEEAMELAQYNCSKILGDAKDNLRFQIKSMPGGTLVMETHK